MSHLMPHLLYVSSTDPSAPWSSISSALRQATAGDTVLVGPGRYAPSLTEEQLPLYVPPGVMLIGAGQGESIIDGEGAMELSFRPVRAGQSLVLLDDRSTLSDLSITNSGGNGVGTQPGARVLIVRNEIRQHGQHGLIVSGPQEAIIKDNRFVDNGTRQFSPVTPRPAAARQGHHIFVQGQGGAANSILIADNTMQRAFADGLALVVFFDEPDAVSLDVRVMNNQIEQSERRVLTIAGSFGPCRTRVSIDVRHNVIRDNAATAIAAQAARPLVTSLIRDCYLRLTIIDNQCHQNGEGIAVFGGFGPAEGNRLDATILGNHITGTARHAIRLVGGVGFGGYAARHNRLRAVISRNRIEAAGDTPIFMQGGTSEGQEEATDNAVLVQVSGNELPEQTDQPSIVLNDGKPGNMVHLEEPAPPHTRVGSAIPYRA